MTATHPFARFEWMIAFRYLRARRAHGSISVIAGFSFLGIVLGVAALIVVMAVMNGFRHDLMEKMIGLNGHLFLQGVETPLTDYDAVRMYDTKLVEEVLDVKITDTPPAEPIPAQAYEEYFSEGGEYRHIGKGSRIREKMNAEERAIFARERVRG